MRDGESSETVRNIGGDLTQQTGGQSSAAPALPVFASAGDGLTGGCGRVFQSAMNGAIRRGLLDYDGNRIRKAR